VPDPGGEVTDAAAEAEGRREDAQRLRVDRARRLAEAQEQIERITAEAQAEAARFDAAIRDADAEAERWEAIARRDAAIVAAEAEIAALQQAQADLAAEAARLDTEAARLTVRLDELSAARADAEQRQLTARRADDIDVDEAVARVKAAQADLAAITDTEQHPREQLAAVQARLTAIRGEGGDLAQVTDRLGRASIRLADLRREERGLPPLQERQALLAAVGMQTAVALAGQDPESMLNAMLAMVPDGETREELRRQFGELGELDGTGVTQRVSAAGAMAVRLMPALAAWLDAIAGQDSALFAAMKSSFLGGRPPAPESLPSLREELDKAAFTVLSDGTVRYEPGYQGWNRTGHVPAPEPGFGRGL
jgi:hypothetical protein